MKRSNIKPKPTPLTPSSRPSSSKIKQEPSNKASISKSRGKTPSKQSIPSKTPKKLTYPQSPGKTGDKHVSARSTRKTPQPKIKLEDQGSSYQTRRKSPGLSTMKKNLSESKEVVPPIEKKILPSETKETNVRSVKKTPNKNSPKRQLRLERSRSKSNNKVNRSNRRNTTETKIKKEKTEPKEQQEATTTKDEKVSVKKEKKSVIITAKKIKEETDEQVDNDNNINESESENDDNINENTKTIKTASAATSGFKTKTPTHQFSYDVDTKAISQEIENILKKIEKKRQSRMSSQQPKLGVKVKRERVPKATKKTAKDYNYELQSNPNINTTHYVDFKALSSQPEISNSDLALSLIEIAVNAAYYVINFSTRSKMFWEDILEYKVLRHVFKDYKSETLRKYWRMICKYDASKIVDVITKHKEFFDSMPIKLRTIITAIAYLFEDKIDNIETYIKNIQIDIRKCEVFKQEYTDPQTGEVTSIKDVRTTIKKRNRYEPGYKRQFVGKNMTSETLEGLNEIYGESDKQTQYQNVIKQLIEEDSSKLKYLQQLNEDEKRKLMQINEDDKFLFKVIDNVIDELLKECGTQYTREYVFEMLCANSMNIGRTYLALTDKTDKEQLPFTTIDDNIIMNMKDSEQYQELLRSKGEALVKERQHYLNH